MTNWLQISYTSAYLNSTVMAVAPDISSFNEGSFFMELSHSRKPWSHGRQIGYWLLGGKSESSRYLYYCLLIISLLIFRSPQNKLVYLLRYVRCNFRAAVTIKHCKNLEITFVSGLLDLSLTGKEGSVFVLAHRQDVSVGIFHRNSPPLHRTRANFHFLILQRRWLLCRDRLW